MVRGHDALAVALATAQMLQVYLHQAETRETTCPAQLLEMQNAQHWLGQRQTPTGRPLSGRLCTANRVCRRGR
jgi:hypothetical protein